MVSQRHVWTDEDPKPAPSTIREWAEFGNVVDRILTQARGLLGSPSERAGIKFVVDLAKGQRPDPGPAGPTIETTAGPAKQEVKDTVMRFDVDKLMVEFEKGVETLVAIQGDRPIAELPALLSAHRAAVVEQVKKTLAGCIVYEVPEHEPEPASRHASQGDGDPRPPGDRQE